MRILAVVVRYKMPLEASQTILSLSEMIRLQPDLAENIYVLIWDNSPTPLQPPQLPFRYRYEHTGENIGVSGAYNCALDVAEQNDFPWMLLLDQDTTLPKDFISKLLEQIDRQASDESIAAIAPFLIDGTMPSSPVAVLCGRNKVIAPPFHGVFPGEIFAANSGVTIRTAALREAGGYNEDFWLDLSDVVVFHKLHRQGKRVWIDGNLQLQHHITNNDYDGSMSPQRYSNFIAAEGAYWDLYRGWIPRTVYMARLFGRIFRQHRRYKNKIFSKITRHYFFRRLTSRQRNRLYIWRQQSIKRNLPAVSEGNIIG